MIKYNLKIGLRNISRQKIYSFINIFGLAIGICIFLLIALFVNNEYSYDKFNPEHERVVRMEFFDWCVIPPGVGHIMNGQLPDIEKICRYETTHNRLLKYKKNETTIDRNKYVNIGARVDSTFFDVFGVNLLKGNTKNALTEPYSIILTKTLSDQLFGNEEPLNKVVSMENRLNLKVTGIIDDSENFHLSSSFYIPISLGYKTSTKERMETLRSWNYLTYFLLKDKDVNKQELQSKILNFLRKYDTNQNLVDEGWEPTDLIIRNLTDIYFFKKAGHESGVLHGNKAVVNAFIIIAIFIILIALINFINITTARTATRAKEVGVRKVVGGTRKKLIMQFVSESIIISIIAMVLGLTFLQILLPEFNNLTDKALNLSNTLFTPIGFIILLFISILIGLSAGIYPALYISFYNTQKVLKGEITRGKSAGNFRIALIIFQFIIASILISGTITIYQQINYMKNKKLGFNKEHVVNLIMKGKTFKNREDFKQKLLQNPNIKGVSFSHGIPGKTGNTNTLQWKDERIETRVSSGDPDFFNVLGVEIVEGRGFDWELETDKRNVCLINQTLADMIGFEEPVGQRINVDYDNYMWNRNFSIIGIYKDYHLESLHNSIVPMALFWNDRAHYQVSIKINGQNIKESLEHIEKTWNQFASEFPFEYLFLDQRFDQMYKAEERTQKIVIYFSALAIFIACLGLFGLSAFMTQRRFKEIGIRKVLGSSIEQIVARLSREFAIIVLIANIIAIPIGWLVLNAWLDDYPYKISIKWWIFPIALILTLLVALLTITFHSLKASLSNPVDAIRYE